VTRRARRLIARPQTVRDSRYGVLRTETYYYVMESCQASPMAASCSARGRMALCAGQRVFTSRRASLPMAPGRGTRQGLIPPATQQFRNI